MMRDFETVFNEQVGKLEEHERNHIARADAWRNVKRVYKKDGGEFAALGKNFTGCKVVSADGWNDNDKMLQVVYRDERGNYTTDDIKIRHFGNTDGIDPARIVRVYGLKDSYYLTVDELEEAIKGRIAREEEFARKTREDIETFRIHRGFMEDICERVARIVDATKDREHGNFLGCYHIAETIAKTIN